jgi:hypothetical protein
MVKSLGASPEDFEDGHVLVSATIELRHDEGPADETYPPFLAYAVDNRGRTIDEQYNEVLEWADGSSIYPPTLPPGTNGVWIPVFQVPTEFADGVIVAVQAWGRRADLFFVISRGSSKSATHRHDPHPRRRPLRAQRTPALPPNAGSVPCPSDVRSRSGTLVDASPWSQRSGTLSPCDSIVGAERRRRGPRCRSAAATSSNPKPID